MRFKQQKALSKSSPSARAAKIMPTRKLIGIIELETGVSSIGSPL
jgi:hypothetical protein